MEVKNSLTNFQSIIQSLPLEEILKTAESLSTQVPKGAAGISSSAADESSATSKCIAYVIKLLKMLISCKNVLGSNTDKADSAANFQDGSPEEMMGLLDEMIDVAAEDGELSSEEEENLLDMARDLGLDEKAVLKKVKKKCSGK